MSTHQNNLFPEYGEVVDQTLIRTQDAPHASFLNPEASFNAEPRESIEVRALVFTYPKEKPYTQDDDKTEATWNST